MQKCELSAKGEKTINQRPITMQFYISNIMHNKFVTRIWRSVKIIWVCYWLHFSGDLFTVLDFHVLSNRKNCQKWINAKHLSPRHVYIFRMYHWDDLWRSCGKFFWGVLVSLVFVCRYWEMPHISQNIYSFYR